MNGFNAVFRREFLGFFRTPVAYVFLIVFLVVSAAFPWFLAGFFDARVASLETFFVWLPWIYLFLMPAAAMRLWSEERRSGTWELLLTLPIDPLAAVLGKFAAAWAFVSAGLVLTLPIAFICDYLGDPDWGVIFASYLGAWLMAGAYLAVCVVLSALTKNQVVAFVLSVVVCLVLVLLGFSPFNQLMETAGLPAEVVGAVANFSFVTRFEPFYRGLITLSNVAFFISLMGGGVFLNTVIIQRQ